MIVEIRDGSVEIFGDPAGLRDLARWCIALSDEQAQTGAHIHLGPGTVPLAGRMGERSVGGQRVLVRARPGTQQ